MFWKKSASGGRDWNIWVIDQTWGRDGCILAELLFCASMDGDEIEVHKNERKRLLCSHLDRTSLKNKDLSIELNDFTYLIKNQEWLIYFESRKRKLTVFVTTELASSEKMLAVAQRSIVRTPDISTDQLLIVFTDKHAALTRPPSIMSINVYRTAKKC